MKTLEDFHAYQTLLSDENSFKATLQPISYDQQILITTKIESIEDCDSWEGINRIVLQTHKEHPTVVCLIGIDSNSDLPKAQSLLAEKPQSLSTFQAVLLENPNAQIGDQV